MIRRPFGVSWHLVFGLPLDIGKSAADRNWLRRKLAGIVRLTFQGHV